MDLDGKPFLRITIQPPDETEHYSQEDLVRIRTKMSKAFSDWKAVQEFAHALRVLATFAPVDVELFYDDATEKDIPLALLEAADLAVVFGKHGEVLFRKSR